jgi:antirestriction protein ArdC
MSDPRFEKELTAITDRIIASLEGGKIPWHKPWNGVSLVPHNWATGKAYAGGINTILLMMTGFADVRWAGFGQGKKKGAMVTRGEKATTIFCPILGYGEKNGEKYQWVKGWRTVKVFNAAQMTGTPDLEVVDDIDPTVGFEAAAKVLARSKAKLSHGGNRACYSPREDAITMPPAGCFDDLSFYWATMMHELVHWTGHDSRLDRDGVGGGIRSREDYAREELVAEMGSAFLCHTLGINRPEIMEGHEAYIGSWIRVLKSDPKAIITAAGQAKRAMDLLLK